VRNVLADNRKAKQREILGFRDGTSSVHTSRTMMLSELTLVLEHTDANATNADYLESIVGQNALGKPTQSTRVETARKLSQLYTLDAARPVFRVFRHFWEADETARPMLAYLAATARDPLLRDATLYVNSIAQGSTVSPSQISMYLSDTYPKRFQESTGIATAQRLASSWSQAGFLAGKVNKKRTRPVVTPVVVTYALLLGYLCGMRGKMLLDTVWTRMLDRTPAEIADLATDASKQGWMSYKAAGSVVEVTFPGLLTSQEEKASYEPN
jgi:hypothetical protein